MRVSNYVATAYILAVALFGCGGDGGGGTDTYTVGGTITGLTGSGLVLQNNGGDDLAMDADGGFTFVTALDDTSAYSVTVLTQPGSPVQTCTVSNGSGTLAGADVTDVAVTCSADIETYTIGGTVTGLTGSGLVLQNSGGDDLTISADGSFAFDTALDDTSAYSVTVLTQPGSPSQICTVANGSGTLAGADVTDVTITCATDTYTIGGTVTGLVGSGLVLQNNGGDDLTISSDGSFTFAAIADTSAYSVTVLTQPGSPAQTCTVASGSGTLAGDDVTDVTVTCATDTFTVGGTVTGLTGTGLVLQNNGGDDLAISADGSFTFDTAIADTSAYSVTVLTQPGSPAQTCTVVSGSGSGTLAGADVTDVDVYCPPAAVTVTVSGTGPKVLTFNWNDVSADHYKLLKDPDGASGYTQEGADLSTTSVDETIPVHLVDWVNARYIVQSCDANAVCTDSAAISITSAMLDTIGYFKASNTSDNDNFGRAVSLSADGNTIAVGAIMEDCDATCDGVTIDNANAGNSGAVYVFHHNGTAWSQQAFLKASNVGGIYGGVFGGDYFGYAVSLSADGNTLAVGAIYEDGSDGGNSNGDDFGAVYVFSRSGVTWTQQAHFAEVLYSEAGDRFGQAVSLSADGNTLAVGAPEQDRNAMGFDNGLTNGAGAVYVYRRSSSTWTLQALNWASNAGAGDHYGAAVSLSADGNTLAVGSYAEDSNATGIDGDESDESETDSGAVYVLTYSGTAWSQQAYVKADNTGSADNFGISVSLSGDGATLAVGAYKEGTTATASGAVYLFGWSGTAWTQQHFLKASTTDAADLFGYSVSLSTDGNTLAVGAFGEDSNATGIDGDENDGSMLGSGAVYVFTFSGTVWSQEAFVKASNTDATDAFGFANSVCLSADGNTLAVGAYSEDSNATGIGGDQTSNTAHYAGAVYLY